MDKVYTVSSSPFLQTLKSFLKNHSFFYISINIRKFVLIKGNKYGVYAAYFADVRARTNENNFKDFDLDIADRLYFAKNTTVEYVNVSGQHNKHFWLALPKAK